MTDHPSTFRADPADGNFDWDDSASLHLKNDGGGVLHVMKAIKRGTLAQMVGIVRALPETDRGRYVIQKSGDHRLEAAEIMALAGRPDYPG